ncbi:MAG: M20/M25/M40 family metallo-hydrolase [Acidobacteria bacterium]|nr:MAG: M20/M25/M40 family metallo-hydrolase [Acidobacteriota bacterium]
MAVADEEAGGEQGAGWLLDAHPELFAGAGGVLGEGGANRVVLDRLVFWGIEVDQKRPLWLRVSSRGRGAHASMPFTDTATHTLITALARLIERPPAIRVGPTVRRYLGAMAEIEGGAMRSLFHRLDDVVASGEAMSTLPPSWLMVLVDSLQVTRLEAASSINVIAPLARAWIDARLLPDSDADAVLAEVRRTLGDRLEVEVLLASPPAPPSPIDHPLYQALRRVLGVRAPVVPAVVAGITDARYFRQRGIATYGFNPFTLESQEMRGVHALDEAIPLDELERGVEVMSRVVRAYVVE